MQQRKFHIGVPEDFHAIVYEIDKHTPNVFIGIQHRTPKTTEVPIITTSFDALWDTAIDIATELAIYHSLDRDHSRHLDFDSTIDEWLDEVQLLATVLNRFPKPQKLSNLISPPVETRSFLFRLKL